MPSMMTTPPPPPLNHPSTNDTSNASIASTSTGRWRSSAGVDQTMHERSIGSSIDSVVRRRRRCIDSDIDRAGRFAGKSAGEQPGSCCSRCCCTASPVSRFDDYANTLLLIDLHGELPVHRRRIDWQRLHDR
ncbi:hypothetical protein Aduo_007512 [Ancylostoma duodenale]